ncbi:unnamed protein product [Cylindrotheca closterium]|uniref:Uncharacterized protein n=1 Tax=Cylindrotheca closterium TaxID=2856 RepID=A0AAD2GC42_9STRA|nr:unnamed protein product [Cylindrotheca closterium]
MTGQLIESFEVESSASSLRDALLVGVVEDSSSTMRQNSCWHPNHVCWPSILLRARTIGMALAGVMVFMLLFSAFPNRSSSATLNEELQSQASPVALLPPYDDYDDDDEITTPAFLIGDISSSICHLWDNHGDLGLKPFGEEIDRTFCEKQQEEEGYDWLESLKYSEMLRCYNMTYRWCFVNELPEGLDSSILAGSVNSGIADLQSKCVFRFYDHQGILYSTSGQRMPKAFNSKCSHNLISELWHSVNPISGCGIEHRYRFCDNEGNVDWDKLNGPGPFNCREFDAVDVYQMGSADESGMEDLCKAQAKGCAKSIQQACKDGKYHEELLDPMSEECMNFVYFMDYDQICIDSP